MRKILLPAIVSVTLFISCNSSDTQTDSEEVVYDSVVDQPDAPENLDSNKTVTNIPSLWKVEFKEKNKSEKLEKPSDENLKSLSPNELITALNQTYPDIHLDFKKVSHDTIYLEIPQSVRLTQQLGSTGAYNYLATTVYNLTELPNVKFVNLQFEQGDHATPGTYSRNDFKRLR